MINLSYHGILEYFRFYFPAFCSPHTERFLFLSALLTEPEPYLQKLPKSFHVEYQEDRPSLS
jgi:hypothetical protein